MTDDHNCDRPEMTDDHNCETTGTETLAVSAATCSSQALELGTVWPGSEPRTTPLHVAVGTGDRARLERELDATGDPDTRDAARKTPLMLAAAVGTLELMRILLERGADPSATDNRGRTSLHAAAERGCLESVRLLLRWPKKINVSAKDKEGITPLGVTRSLDCLRELIVADSALSAADLPLMLRDRPNVLRQLLDLGVQPSNDGKLHVTYRPLRDIGSANDWPFEAELISQLQLTGRWQMLSHPAVEVLLKVTHQDTLWLAITNLVCVAIFLGVLCAKVMVDLYQVAEHHRSNLWVALLAFNCARIPILLVKLTFTRLRILRTLRLWPEVITTALTFVLLFIRCEEWIRAVHAMTLLSGFLQLTLVVESIPIWKATKAISSLLLVTRSIVGYLVLYLPILFGFALAFFVVLKKDVQYRKDSLFRGDVLLMTVAAMVIGNVDVTEINKQAPSSGEGFGVCSFIFILFLVLVPLVLLNMLLALTINDTNKFLSEGSSEYLHHVADMTSTIQRALFSLDRWLQTLHNRLPGWLFSCVSSLMLCVKWRSALPRQFDFEGSCVTLVVDPVADDGKTVRVIVWGSKQRYGVSKSVRHSLDQIVQDRAAAETEGMEMDLPPPLSDKKTDREVLQTLTGQLHDVLKVQKMMAQQLQLMRERRW